MKIKRHQEPFGLTLLELIVVMVIVAIAASLALVSLRPGVDNRKARQVLGTAQSIAHAVRMYEQETGNLPTQSNLSELLNQGYLKDDEFAYRNQYTYSFVPNTVTPSRWGIEASKTDSSRLLRVENRGDSFAVTDSAGVVSS